MLCAEASRLDIQVGDRINNLLARTEGLGMVGPAVHTTTTMTKVQPGMAFRQHSVQHKDVRQVRQTRTPEHLVLVENISSNIAVGGHAPIS